MQFPLRLQTFLFRQGPIELYVPDAALIREAYERGNISFPYWSRVWPAAKALGLFLLLHPQSTNGKKVLELGAGLGLPSLVAARNAAHVLCTDGVPEAVETVKLSAAHLHLQNVSAQVLDWNHSSQDLQADVLLLSDINYDPVAFAALQNSIETFLQKGTTVLLSTPQRLMAKNFIAPLFPDCTQQEEIIVPHEGNNVAITVMVLQRTNAS